MISLGGTAAGGRCYQGGPYYPKVIGGPNNTTEILSIDSEFGNYFLVGGYSLDPLVCEHTPFAALYSLNLPNLIWGFSYSLNLDKIIKV